MVAVDYADLLAITLPHNRRHFDEIYIVTTPDDVGTQDIADDYKAQCVRTDAFYQDGAVFNKGRALEIGLSCMGRDGWICIMDADILLPRSLHGFKPEVGHLYTPKRRVLSSLDWTQLRYWADDEMWNRLPIHNDQQFAGYMQIFHGDDPRVKNIRPWYETDWKHAGGADTMFQNRWPAGTKVRPPFEVLHLGEVGQNWCGRVTPYLCGAIPPEAEARQKQLAEFHAGRKPGPHKYDHEKLGI